MTQPTDPGIVAEQLLATSLAINASSKYPGTIPPDLADSYTAAFAEARQATGLKFREAYLLESLAHVAYQLAEFAAGRPSEPVTDLVRAFAGELERRRL